KRRLSGRNRPNLIWLRRLGLSLRLASHPAVPAAFGDWNHRLRPGRGANGWTARRARTVVALGSGGLQLRSLFDPDPRERRGDRGPLAQLDGQLVGASDHI